MISFWCAIPVVIVVSGHQLVMAACLCSLIAVHELTVFGRNPTVSEWILREIPPNITAIPLRLLGLAKKRIILRKSGSRI